MIPLLRKEGLIEGRLIQRYKRFLADVELAGGEVVTAHCTNTGSMKTCWEPGDRVLLERAANPDRKLKFTWLACERPGGWVGVETGIPNRVVAEAARRDLIPGFTGLHEVRPEVKYGAENSRIDVWAKDGEDRHVFIEVKNTTLKGGSASERQGRAGAMQHAAIDGGSWALFPDAVTERGAKHLRELQGMVREGHRAAIAFFIHRTDVDRFDAARSVDPAYAAQLDRAAGAGVLVLPLRVRMEADPSPGGWSLAWALEGLLPWIRTS